MGRMSLRHRPSGPELFSISQLLDPPQLEAVYTVMNRGDSVTQWRDTRGDIHEAWTGAVGSSAYFLVLTFCICIISTRALC